MPTQLAAPLRLSSYAARLHLNTLPPQALTNITNDYYDNCNNQSITNHIQDTSPEAFARGSRRELRDVVSNFDNGMHV